MKLKINGQWSGGWWGGGESEANKKCRPVQDRNLIARNFFLSEILTKI